MARRSREMEMASLKAINDLWWVGALQGMLALFFGITALFWPQLTLVTLVYLLSAFIMALGVIEILYGVLSVKIRSNWWMSLLVGLIALGAGIYLVRHPNVSFSTFILVVGLSFIARGLIDTFRVFTEKSSTSNKILMGIISIAAILAGIIILLQPVSGGLAFVWVLGLYAIFYGIFMVAVSFEVHKELQELTEDIVSGKQRPVSIRFRG